MTGQGVHNTPTKLPGRYLQTGIVLSIIVVALLPVAALAVVGGAAIGFDVLMATALTTLAIAGMAGVLLCRLLDRRMHAIFQAAGELAAAHLPAAIAAEESAPAESPASNPKPSGEQAGQIESQRPAVEKALVQHLDQAPTSIDVLRRVDDMLGRIRMTTESIDDIAGESDLNLLSDAVDLVRADHAGAPKNGGGTGLSERLADVCDALGRTHTAILTEMGRLSDQVATARQAMRQQIRFEGTGVLEPLYLADMVDEAVRINRCELEKSQVRIRRDYEDLPPVILDKLKVMHILINLVKHAADDLATIEADEPRMELTLSFDDDAHIRVKIADNGVGFEDGAQARAPRPTEIAPRSDYPFGFAQCCKLARDMGGAVKATSPGVGQGATYVLEFPCRPLRKQGD